MFYNVFKLTLIQTLMVKIKYKEVHTVEITDIGKKDLAP